VVSATPESKRSPSPDGQLAEQLDKLAFGLKKKRRSDFPWASDLSDSDMSLNDIEEHFQTDKATSRLDQIETARDRFAIDLRSLQSQEYTTAMNVLGTHIYAAKRISDFVQFGNKMYADSPDILESFKGKPLEFALYVATKLDEDIGEDRGGTVHRDRYRRLVEHYRDGEALTARSGKLKSGYVLSGSSDRHLGPIEHHNAKRLHLRDKIERHNADNERYNDDHPRLHDNFKCKQFDYTYEKDHKKRLTPEISHLLPLEEAVEKEIWREYEKTYRENPPARPGVPIKHLDKMFSLGPVRWRFNTSNSVYELDHMSWYDPPSGPP
jgi:hypothetical protein